jgi:DNA polymerase-4
MFGRYDCLCEHVFVSSILHADLDSFFASVEQRDEPRLQGKPVIVGPGVVLAASYEAKAFGVRTAMGQRRARQLCPQAIVVPARFKAYSEASKAVFRVFEDTAPVVEALSIDEAFLDVRGMERSVGSPLEIAHTLRHRVRDEVGLPITVGVARTKFLAKVASGVAKPDGLLLVAPRDELAFLRPLEIERLWGVGPVTSRKLRAVGISTVGEVARMDEGQLIALVGRAQGRQLHALAHNRDPRRVEIRRRRGSIGSQRARGRRPWTPDDLDADLIALVDRVTRRLRKASRVGRTVVLRLRFDDFTRATRSHTLLQSTSSTEAVLHTARGLLREAMPMLEHRGVTLVGISVANLDDALPRQLALQLEARNSVDLDEAIDSVRERFGSQAITRGVLVGRGERIEMPLLPD